MHVAVEGNSDAGWHLMLSVPPLWVLAHALWDWAQQMSLNQIVFALAVQRKEAAPVVTTQVSPKASAAEPPKVSVTVPLETHA
jgi:hypothetical protein